MFTKKDLAKIIIPLLIEQILAITVGMADSVMVSSAGEAAVSGVSLVDSLNLLLVYVFSALAGGGAVVIAQLIGKKDIDGAKESSKQLVWVVFVVSSIICLLSVAFRVQILNLIFGKIDSDVMENAKIYFLFTSLSYPFLGLYNAGASIFRASGDSKTSMLISLSMNLINIAGNAVLILVFKMGAAGAAIATLFSRIVGAFIMMAYVRSKKNPVPIKKLLHYKPDFAIIKRICGIGIPNGVENGMFQFGKVLTQSIVSGFGTAQIAANAVAGSLVSFQYAPGTAIGLGMITVVGQCVGASEKEQAKKYAKKLLGITYVSIWIISIILCVFSKPFVSLYGLSSESMDIARDLILFHSIFSCSIWPIAFTLPNAFRAASDVKFTMILSICSMWAFRVGLSYLLALGFSLGVFGVWIAMTCGDWVFRAICFGIRFLRGTWLTKYHEIKYTS